MPTATAARLPDRARSQRDGLRCRIRLADGRVFAGEFAPERHRALQLGMLHEQTAGLVELAAGSRRDGRLQITTRRRSDHFLPGGGASDARVAYGAARARRAPRRTGRGGVRRSRGADGAARGEAGGQRDPVSVGRRRPARAAARAVGVPRRASLPHADRERRVRRLPRLLSAGGAAPGHARGRRRRASWSSRSSAPTCGSSTGSGSVRTAGRASPTRRARSGRG